MTEGAQLTMIPVGEIAANDYNPNWMSDAAFAELVAEVRHLGKLPKPVIVRSNGEGFVIVDGEHGWRAAKEVGLADVPCEISDADDFEARRQTYKRNQHGEHNPVLLGRMFEQMMEQRDLSRRALAKEIDVSEGTVRNALMYAAAATARNSYAEDDWSDEIAPLPVRAVRTYLSLPHGIRDPWLNDGASLDSLHDASEYSFQDQAFTVDHSEEWQALVDAGLSAPLEKWGFPYAKQLWVIFAFLEHTTRLIPDLYVYVLPMIERGMTADVIMNSIRISKVDGKWQPTIEPEPWAEMVNEACSRAHEISELQDILDAMIRRHLAKGGQGYDFTDPRTMELMELVDAGPSYIRESKIDSLLDKAVLADLIPHVPEKIRDQAGKEAVRRLESRDGWATASPEAMEALGIEMAAPQIKSIRAELKKLTAANALQEAVDEIEGELGREYFNEARSKLYGGDIDGLVSAAVEATSAFTYMHEAQIGKQPALEVLRKRLAALPLPELKLVVALMRPHDRDMAPDLWKRAAEAAERQGGAS